jgi:succinate dehydrogenase / fumarate reductase cytochrome b subunit
MRFSQALQYRLPLAAFVSFLHRAAGALMFVQLPFVVWLFDASVTSEVSYERFRSLFDAGLGGLPPWVVKLVVLGLIWSYLHHFAAGLRHLWMDVTHQVTRQAGYASAVATLALSLPLTAALGARLFGLY